MTAATRTDGLPVPATTRPHRRAGWTALVVAALALVPFVLPGYFTSLATLMLIYALLAMSVDLLAGYAGRTSLCHGAIFGTATYVVMYVTTTQSGNPWLAAVLGLLAAIAVGAVFAALAVRTTGVYFLLLTLALGMVVWGVCQRWTSVSGGENGLRGVSRPALLADAAVFYWFVLVVGALATLAMWRLVCSPFGLALKGIRESESRMRSVGYHTTWHLFLGFVFSAAMAGLAGVLYAWFNSFVSPSTVALAQSVKGLLMVIVGGVGTLFGGIVGSILIVVLENVASSFTERWSMVLGALFVLTMIFAPEGIVGKLRSHAGRRAEP
ncbi:branched-chain amino acid ABC transporter permease [Ramlibacter alkalitolerans]|jgi:branched-chain amino acid transport system permease protein|uniref:Branched-chain amino acid ABC transporter permease n=1 Tax=Ramlibacter alkalitolerans TaxID=2039631 RepID=A0ABS1JUR1_9BURK|nr:branched-chain amino acid ABC transporter permease [Ramlibacter alkalitolerans]MBL0427989.1 branched-chain amino acid ABC transporter permease [Ramlibacter alkalitolerans]